MSDALILSNAFDMKDLIPKNIAEGRKPSVGRHVADEKSESPNRFQNTQTTMVNEANKKTILISQAGFLNTRNQKFFNSDQVPLPVVQEAQPTFPMSEENKFEQQQLEVINDEQL